MRASGPRLLRRLGLATCLLAGSLGLVTVGARAQGPAPCDPAIELCLLSAAPWTAPQVLRYRAPASADDSLAVNWTRGGKSGPARKAKVIARDATTTTWRIELPRPAAGTEGGDLRLNAVARAPQLRRVDTGVVRPVLRWKRLRIDKTPRLYRADLGFGSRARVRGAVSMELHGRYPTESWERVKRWQLARTVRAGKGRRVILKVRASRIKKLCKRFAGCRLRATGRLYALGYRLARRRDSRKVPTPKERFTGRLDFISGSTRPSGSGRLYSYAVYVEDHIKIDRKGFARELYSILGHEKGWGRTGRVAFRQVDSPGSANTRIILASPGTVDRLCAPLATRGYVSCTQGSSIVLNLNRWRYAVPHWNRKRLDYRRMLVNHEMGHRMGQGHRGCSGGKAPVMQQQTYGLQGCRANPWPLSYEVASLYRATRSGSATAAGRSVAE